MRNLRSSFLHVGGAFLPRRPLQSRRKGRSHIGNRRSLFDPFTMPSSAVSDLSANTRLIDLSHTVEHGMITYKGLPAPIVCDYLSREASRARYAEGTEFQIGQIEMVANTGTYVDSPFHRYAHGKDLSELALE